MPRNGSGVYSKPAGTTAVPNTTIESAKFNQVVDDIAQDLNFPRPITAGGTGAESVAAAQAALSLDNKMVYVPKNANYTAVATDNNATIFFSATATLTLTDVATLGANWHVTVIADGGTVTIDPTGSETVNGAATIVLPSGMACEIICSGTDFKARLMTLGKSSGSNWTRLLDGKLLQWGTTTGITDAGGNLGVFFPTAFAGAASYNVVAWNGDSGVAGGNLVYSQLRSTPWPQATGFAVSARTGNTGAAYANAAIRVDWFAIGVAP
ncbi:hypothetical protein ATCR1_06826 [Agrobacterium tumefaciens CCNWGS0286]|uniref:gp53-like domain-containing protein n=1 Tax=Agrobacterium tumefaciens TaxID=358 RepID=UPI0002334B1D|nr:hypothetical protein [Agrobacterium tumefaciens]EHH07560.1 hypothetical protein ATCR1_06826 [Agrobacterium tumefaciens CCNWGS0286]